MVLTKCFSLGLVGGMETTSINSAIHLDVGFHAVQITNVTVTKITFFAFVTDHGVFVTRLYPDGVAEHRLAIVLDVSERAHTDLVKEITVVFICIDNDAGGARGRLRYANVHLQNGFDDGHGFAGGNTDHKCGHESTPCGWIDKQNEHTCVPIHLYDI